MFFPLEERQGASFSMKHLHSVEKPAKQGQGGHQVSARTLTSLVPPLSPPAPCACVAALGGSVLCCFPGSPMPGVTLEHLRAAGL